MIIPSDLERKARDMVLNEIEQGGDMWDHVTTATVELIVEAVALDLLERELARPSQPHKPHTANP